jgi:hypothetical protein
MIVLSLCDYTTTMVQPWLEAGYECWCVDVQHPPGCQYLPQFGGGQLVKVGADINSWLPPRADYAIVFAFPPCTNLAISGARWFKEKGLQGLAEGFRLVERCAEIAAWTEAPWMLENPVSTISSYWRKPDYTFHPWNYTVPNESKKTCLWTGGGFVMPPFEVTERPSNVQERVWKLPPSEDRANLRSATPEGFARAVFEANRR